MHIPIQFIYFDLDDTLLNHHQAQQQAIEELCQAFPALFERLSVEQVQQVYHAHNVTLWQQYGEGKISKAELQRLRFELPLAALSVEAEAGPLHDHYMTCYAKHWQLDQHALAAFQTLAGRFPVGLLSNGFAEVQRAKLERFPEIRDQLTALVISEEVGYLKPHPAIFEHAASVAGVLPGEILYVGDSYHSDVLGGLKAGWQVAWYTNAAASGEEGRVFRFSQWPDLLARLL